MLEIEIFALWDSDIPPILFYYFPPKQLFTGKHFHEIVTTTSKKSFMSRDFFTFNFKDDIMEKAVVEKTFHILNEIFSLIFAEIFVITWWWSSITDITYAEIIEDSARSFTQILILNLGFLIQIVPINNQQLFLINHNSLVWTSS